MFPEHGFQNKLIIAKHIVFRQIFDFDCVVIHLNGFFLEGIDKFVLSGPDNVDIEQNA